MPITATPVNPTDPRCCGDQSVVSSPLPTTPVACPPVAAQPPVPTNDEGVALVGKQTAVIVPTGKNRCFSWQLRTSAGVPINLTQCLAVDDPPRTIAVRFRIREALSTCGGDPLDANNLAEVVSAEQGQVKVCFTTELTRAGIFLGTFGVFEEYDNPDAEDTANPIIQSLLYENEFFVFVQHSTWGSNTGLPRVESIREQLADFAGENTLTMQQRFSDADIASAAIFCVEHWNESLPETPHIRYDTTTFPYRSHWIDAIKGRLFMLHAERLRSQHLPVQGGGITINDKDKYDQYDQRGLYLWTEYKKFVASRKMRENMRVGHSARTIWGYGGG